MTTFFTVVGIFAVVAVVLGMVWALMPGHAEILIEYLDGFIREVLKD